MSTEWFFATVRPMFGGKMSQEQVDGINLLLGECKRARVNRQGAAYVLATAFHETGATMAPVVENLNYSAGGLRKTWPHRFPTDEIAAEYARQPEKIANHVYTGRMGNDQTGDGWRFRGRGFVQITGRANYRRLGEALGITLETQPELALDPAISARICVLGMQRGLFTGVSLDDVSEPETSEPDFEGDRAIVNGRDRAKKIAVYAETFYAALKDVDMLAESRTIKAAKAQQTTSKGAVIGTAITGAGAALGETLTGNTDGIINMAKQGLSFGALFKWDNAGEIIAVILVLILIYQLVQAKRIERARRDDNEVRGV